MINLFFYHQSIKFHDKLQTQDLLHFCSPPRHTFAVALIVQTITRSSFNSARIFSICAFCSFTVFTSAVVICAYLTPSICPSGLMTASRGSMSWTSSAMNPMDRYPGRACDPSADCHVRCCRSKIFRRPKTAVHLKGPARRSDTRDRLPCRSVLNEAQHLFLAAASGNGGLLKLETSAGGDDV